METPTSAKNKRKGEKAFEITTDGVKKGKPSTVWDNFKKIDGDKNHDECIYFI